MNLTFTDDKQFINKLTELTLESLGDENFGAKELVYITGMNHSTIYRRLKAPVKGPIKCSCTYDLNLVN